MHRTRYVLNKISGIFNVEKRYKSKIDNKILSEEAIKLFASSSAQTPFSTKGGGGGFFKKG
jgi:hypothetical protein